MARRSTMKHHRQRDLTPPSLLIAAHCLTIERKRKRFDAKEFSAILDDLFRELQLNKARPRTYLHSLNEVLHTLNSTSPLVLFSLGSHDFFLLVRDATQDLLQRLHTSYQLNEQEIFVFRNSVLLLENLVERSANPSKLLHWITEANFLQTFGQCLNRMKRILKADENQRSIKQLTRLLGVFSELQERLPVAFHQDAFLPLFKPIVKCLTSSTYTTLFHNLKSSVPSLTNKEKFFLIKCPHFLTGYNGSQQEKSIERFLGRMLPRYASILDQHLSAVKSWTHSTMRAIHNLLTTLIYSEGYYTPYVNDQAFRSLIDHLLRLLDTPALREKIRPSSNNIETLLIDAALTIFTIVVYEPDALDYIRQRKPVAVFRQLTSAPSETIVLNAYVLLAYTVEEEDIKASLTDYSKLLSTILSRLQKAIKTLQQVNANDYSNQEDLTRNSMQLIETLKGLVQYEQIRNELFKSKAVPALIESYEGLQGLPKQVLLDCLWTLAFNENIAEELRRHPHLIASLQQISSATAKPQQSDSSHQNLASIALGPGYSRGLKRVADGLLWKLVREIPFRSKQKPPTDLATQLSSEQYQYDVMISYCYADRKIASKIEQYMINKGLRVWFDRDASHDGAMEAVAEVIEHSACVLMCISDSFKRDNHGHAEVQYGFHRKRPLLPLIVRKVIKPDGWLRSIVDTSTCINLTNSKFKSAMASLLKDISQQQKKRSSKGTPRSRTSSSNNRKETVPIRAPRNASIASAVTHSAVEKRIEEQRAESTRIDPTPSATSASRQEPERSTQPTAPSRVSDQEKQPATDRPQSRSVTPKVDSTARATSSDRQSQSSSTKSTPRVSTELPIITDQQRPSTATPMSSRSVTPTVARATSPTLADRQETISIVSITSHNSLESTMAAVQPRHERVSVKSRPPTPVASRAATETPTANNQQRPSTVTPLSAGFVTPRVDQSASPAPTDRQGSVSRASTTSRNSLDSTMANVQPRQERELVQSRPVTPTASRTPTDQPIVVEQLRQAASSPTITTPPTTVVPSVRTPTPTDRQTSLQATRSIFQSQTSSSISSDSSLTVEEESDAARLKPTDINVSRGPPVTQATPDSTMSDSNPASNPRVADQQRFSVEISRAAPARMGPESVMRQEQQRPVENNTRIPVVPIGNQINEQNAGRTTPTTEVAGPIVSAPRAAPASAEQTRQTISVHNAAPSSAATDVSSIQQERSNPSTTKSTELQSSSALSSQTADAAEEQPEPIERSAFRSSSSSSSSSASSEVNSGSEEVAVRGNVRRPPAQPALGTAIQARGNQNVNVPVANVLQRVTTSDGSVAPGTTPYMQQSQAPMRVEARPAVIVPFPPGHSATVQQRTIPPQQQQQYQQLQQQQHQQQQPPIRNGARPTVMVPFPPSHPATVQQRTILPQQQQQQPPIRNEARPTVMVPFPPGHPATVQQRTILPQQQQQQPPTQLPGRPVATVTVEQRQQPLPTSSYSRPPVMVPRPPANPITVQQISVQQQQWQSPIHNQPKVRPVVIEQRPPPPQQQRSQSGPIQDSTVQHVAVEQPRRPPQQDSRPVVIVPRPPANPAIVGESSQQHAADLPATEREAAVRVERTAAQLSVVSTVPEPTEDAKRIQPISLPRASGSPHSAISLFIEKQKQKASRESNAQSTLSSASSTQSLVTLDLSAPVSDVIPLPEEYTGRVTSNSLYRSLSVNAWSRKDILDFLFDLKLYAMMPLCELMSGQAFIRLFRMCQEKPTRLYSQLNEELRARFNGLTLPIGVYTEFLTEMNGLVGPAVGALPTLLTAQPTYLDRIAILSSSALQQQPASVGQPLQGFVAEFIHESTESPAPSERHTRQ